MTNDKTAKMLERVRALLAKADSTEFPDEADSFRAKADALMTTYAIEQWMVDDAQNAVGERPKPEIRNMNFDWWRDSHRRDELWDLFWAVSSHCRCVVAMRGFASASRGMPVIGLPSDLDYFDVLFTSLMLQMGKQLEPHPDPDGKLEAEVFKLRQAGQPWDRITEQIFRAGLTKPTKRDIEKVNDKVEFWYATNATVYTIETLEWQVLKDTGVWMEMKNRLANANRKHVKENGLEEQRNRVNPQIYQRSFATGFVDEVGRRFRAMVREQTTAHTGSMELALVDIRQASLNLYNEMFPPQASDGKARRSAVVKSPKMDWGSLNAGRAAGAKADIAGHQGRRVGNRRQLGE